jgi:hypothetical protein
VGPTCEAQSLRLFGTVRGYSATHSAGAFAVKELLLVQAYEMTIASLDEFSLSVIVTRS